MIITLEVSDNNEGTASPYWLIIDPRQMMTPDVHAVACMITGPFFSREEAEAVLKAKKHQYSNRARTYCHSANNRGTYYSQYINALSGRNKEERAKG